MARKFNALENPTHRPTNRKLEVRVTNVDAAILKEAGLGRDVTRSFALRGLGLSFAYLILQGLRRYSVEARPNSGARQGKTGP